MEQQRSLTTKHYKQMFYVLGLTRLPLASVPSEDWPHTLLLRTDPVPPPPSPPSSCTPATVFNSSDCSVGQLFCRYSKPSDCITAARLDAANLRHTAFSSEAWCCSARASVVATVSVLTFSHSFDSHSSRSRSRPYWSAAANKCWASKVDVDNPDSSFVSGRTSLYMKCSRALNTCCMPPQYRQLQFPENNTNKSSVLPSSSTFCTTTDHMG